MYAFIKQDLTSQDLSLAGMRTAIINGVPELSNLSNRYSRSKMFDAVYIRRGYGGSSFAASERVKLTSLDYQIKSNEFFSLGYVKINIEEN